MNLKLDPEQFEQLQKAFITEIVENIRLKLVESGIEGGLLEDTTSHIAFSIASAIDDTSAIESDGVAVRPYLTFRTSDEEIVHCGENAYTYEFVWGILKKMFDE